MKNIGYILTLAALIGFVVYFNAESSAQTPVTVTEDEYISEIQYIVQAKTNSNTTYERVDDEIVSVEVNNYDPDTGIQLGNITHEININDAKTEIRKCQAMINTLNAFLIDAEAKGVN